MGEPIVNGEKPSSQFLHHLSTLPVVSASLTYIKNHPYGQKSLQLADQGYANYAKPVLPFFSKPYNYVAPYVAKADSLSNEGLKRVEDRFPIVKKDTETIKGALKGYIHMPFRVVEEGKKHVLQVYSAEYKNCGGGEGYVAAGKAVITTGLTITSESLEWLRACITRAEQKGREGVEAVSEKKVSKK
ncbi:CAP20 [Histoplasma capsulatum G186AR]|nr:CAP20 [Histoplasma capsulatum]QSS68437.1 CAP20 [Histoplasma capsulatum G186AR]